MFLQSSLILSNHLIQSHPIQSSNPFILSNHPCPISFYPIIQSYFILSNLESPNPISSYPIIQSYFILSNHLIQSHPIQSPNPILSYPINLILCNPIPWIISNHPIQSNIYYEYRIIYVYVISK